MNKLLIVLFSFILLASCSPYQRAIQSDDVAVKNKMAITMYEKGKYKKAIRLFEQIAPALRGKPNSERSLYFFGKSYYNAKQYYLAAYQLENFTATYPKSDKKQEAAFLAAKCHYMRSPRYSLDQIDTEKAIEKLQKFIDAYPDSEYLPQANKYIKELTEKKEKKAFEIAVQYNYISDYKSALKALDNFLLDFPGTSYKEKALYYKLDSAYKLARNSVPHKKQQRLQNAKTMYNTLLKFKTDSQYKAEADDMLANIKKELEQFTENK